MSQNTLIAVVEDDAEIRALVRGLLCREGFEAVACTGGGDLDRLMEQRRVDLIVLGLLPAGRGGLSGYRRLGPAPLEPPAAWGAPTPTPSPPPSPRHTSIPTL